MPCSSDRLLAKWQSSKSQGVERLTLDIHQLASKTLTAELRPKRGMSPGPFGLWAEKGRTLLGREDTRKCDIRPPAAAIAGPCCSWHLAKSQPSPDPNSHASVPTHITHSDPFRAKETGLLQPIGLLLTFEKEVAKFRSDPYSPVPLVRNRQLAMGETGASEEQGLQLAGAAGV